MSKFFNFYRIGLRHPRMVLVFFALCSIVSMVAVSRLKIVTNLESLLPKNTKSVQDSESFDEFFEGNHYFMVVIEDDDPERAERFADKFVEEIDGLKGIVFIDYKRPVDFFKKRQLLYLDVDDLNEMAGRIDNTLSLERKGVSLAFNHLMDFADEDDRPDLSFDDIFDKYRRRPWIAKRMSLSTDGGRFVVVRIKVEREMTDFTVARAFLSRLKNIERSLLQGSSFEGLRVGYTGSILKAIEESDHYKREMAVVSVAVFVVLLVVLLMYFRTGESILLIGLPLVASIICTGGVVALLLGRLNVLTTFGAAIIAGLGSDYGIYLLNRYYVARGKGESFIQSCDLAFVGTGSATFKAMITTAGAFLALSFSRFGFFFEFGIVGLCGIVVSYFVMMLMMPSLLSLHRKHGERARQRVAASWVRAHAFLGPRMRKVARAVLLAAPKTVLVSVAVVTLLLFLPAIEQSEICYEEGLLENKNLEAQELFNRVMATAEGSLSPTVLIAPNPHEEERAVNRLTELLNKSDPDDLVYDNVVGLSSFIPQKAPERKIVLRDMRHQVARLRWMPGIEKNEFLGELDGAIEAKAVTKDDLPDDVKKFFVSKDDADKSLIFFYPSFGRHSAESIRRYHFGVRELLDKLDLNVVAVDSHFIADDLLSLIKEESRKIILVVFSFLCLVLLVTHRSASRMVVIAIHLLVSLVLLLGCLWLLSIRLNVMNIVAFPIILGTGIDAMIHFVQRYDECCDVELALKEKLMPICLSSLTTMIGFAGLLLTSSAGLRSLSIVTILGLIMVTTMSLCVLPRLLLQGFVKRFVR